MDENWLKVKVWGEWACFTRPEMKAERVSYPVMTPSAARGILEAIFWKPQFQWQVREIAVLKPIEFFSILRNEVNSKATRERARLGYFADDESERAQRHTLGLRDVAYTICAEAVLKPEAAREHPAKYRDQFWRRVERGQCYFTPYLGCREFAASFGPPSPGDTPIPVTEDLGQMLFDLIYGKNGSRTPRFFNAQLERGVMRVPLEPYREGGG
jgi:CRISPR-associated protein Cas5d